MIFVTLAKFRRKPTKDMIAQSSNLFEQMAKGGTKVLAQYWTLGRYDAIVITEGPDEKSAMKNVLRFGDIAATESLVALSREEATKLVE